MSNKNKSNGGNQRPAQQEAQVTQQDKPVVTEQVLDETSQTNVEGGSVVGDASGDVGVVQTAVVAAAEKFEEVTAQGGKTEEVPTSTGVTGELQALLENALSDAGGYTALTKDTLRFFLRYATAMGPHAAMTEATGHALQIELINTLLGYANSGVEDFGRGFALVLAIVNDSIKNKTGFSDSLPFRYMESINMHAEKRRALAALVHVMQTTANPGLRAAGARQVDMAKATSYGLSDAGRAAIMNFYGV